MGGLVVYLSTILWLLLSTMSRSVLHTLNLRKELLGKIREAKSATDWDKLILELLALDQELKKIWSWKSSGGAWILTIAACVAVAVGAAFNVLDSYGLSGTHDYAMQAFYFT